MNGTLQNHYFPQNVVTPGNPHDRPSRAYWAINPTSKRLVLFVHGFRGDAMKTWREFPSLLPADPACGGHDIVYYGYDGARTAADNSAALLYNFLDAIASTPVAIINSTLPPGAPPRPPSFAYEYITIVAHSLGAVVSRRALLYALANGAGWCKKVHLALFAPAHMGSDIVGLYLGTLAILIPSATGIASVLKIAYPVLKDLEVGSPALVQLLADVAKSTSKGKKNAFLLAKKVIRGTRDRVVTPLPFGDDCVPDVLPGKGHIDVCKPTSEFVEPLKLLRQQGLL